MKWLFITIVLSVGLIGCQSTARIGSDSRVNVAPGVSEMKPTEARAAVEAAYSQFVDVREPSEYASGHPSRARNIPLSTLDKNLDMIEKNEPVYLICQTSNRSREAAKILASAGFKQVVVITGGTVAWQAEGLPME